MNEPIISPWIIYLLGMVDSLVSACIVSITALSIIIYGHVFVGIEIDGEDEKTEKRKIFKKMLIALAVASVLLIFTPSSTTITKMWLASKITPATVQSLEDKSGELAGKVLSRLEKSAVKIIKETKNKGDK